MTRRTPFWRLSLHLKYLIAAAADRDRELQSWRSKLKRVLGHACLLGALEFRWLLRRCARPNPLPRPLIVSLTSYPPRFPTLHLTLQGLLTQSIRPDVVVLWLAREDARILPAHILFSQQYGLQIRHCDDLRSYKKFVPSLRQFGFDAYHVICDDDSHYPRTWLASLVQDAPAQHLVVCQMAHIMTCEGGKIEPYAAWPAATTLAPSARMVAFGVGGVLYPPGALPAQVLDERAFMALCPDQDDLWLYWMSRLNGVRTKLAARRLKVRLWSGTQQAGLFRGNAPVGGGNDRAVQRMAQSYGLPFDPEDRSEPAVRAGASSLSP